MDESKQKEIRLKLETDIVKYGLQVLYVMSDDTGPGFSYSIGLFKTYKHPEIIIIGLKQELSHILINNMAVDIKNGKVYHPFKYYYDILDDFQCYFIEVEHNNYSEYVGQALQYYKEQDFPLIQCVYPTIKGIFPWENEWPEDIQYLQPLLGSINKN